MTELQKQKNMLEYQAEFIPRSPKILTAKGPPHGSIRHWVSPSFDVYLAMVMRKTQSTRQKNEFADKNYKIYRLFEATNKQTIEKQATRSSVKNKNAKTDPNSNPNSKNLEKRP